MRNRDLQGVKHSTQTRPEKIFNTQNPTRTRKNNFSNRNATRTRKNFFFKPKPDPTRTQKNTFFNPKFKNFYFTILALKIFKTAFNIRISIGYKDNFYQVFGINQIFFKRWVKQVSIFFRKKVGFKPEPDPISGLSRVGSDFFRFGYPMQVSVTKPTFEFFQNLLDNVPLGYRIFNSHFLFNFSWGFLTYE